MKKRLVLPLVIATILGQGPDVKADDSLRSSLLFHGALQGGDLAASLYGFHHGLKDSNPLYSNDEALIVTKIGITAFLSYTDYQLGKNGHKKEKRILRIVLGTAYGIAITSNIIKDVKVSRKGR